jgi:hypothetical protein
MADWPSVNFDWLANLPTRIEEKSLSDLTKQSLASLRSNDAASLRKKGTELIALGNVPMGMQLYQAALAREQLAEKGADRAMWQKIYPQIQQGIMKGAPGTTVPGQPAIEPFGGGGPAPPSPQDLFNAPSGALPSAAPPRPQSAAPPPPGAPQTAQGPSEDIISAAQAGGPSPPPPSGPQLAGPPPSPDTAAPGLPAQLPPFMQGATAPAVGAGGAPPGIGAPGGPPPIGGTKPADSASLEEQARFYGSELVKAGAGGKYGAPAVAYNKARLNAVLDQMKLSREERAYHQFNIQAAEQGKPTLTHDEYQKQRENAPVVFKELVDATKPYAEDARSAATVRDSLSLMRSIASNPKFVSGTPASAAVQKFGALASGVRSSLIAMGVPEANLPTVDRFTGPAALLDVFNALSNQSVTATLHGLGNQVSNSDRDFIHAAFPSLALTKEGNQILIEVMDKLAERKQRLGNMAAAYREEHKTRGTGTASDMQMRIQKYVDENNLMAGPNGELTTLGKKIAALGGTPQAAPQAAPQPTQRGPQLIDSGTIIYKGNTPYRLTPQGPVPVEGGP